jgi:hypothetical protein
MKTLRTILVPCCLGILSVITACGTDADPNDAPLAEQTLPSEQEEGSDAVQAASCWVRLDYCTPRKCTCTGCSNMQCEDTCRNLYCQVCTTAC